MTATAPRARGWLFGPVPDLMLGCGLLYAVLFSAFAVFGPALRALQPDYLVPLLLVLVSMPHYGGTLLRVYDLRADRRSYAIFSVWATLLLAALFAWGTFSGLVASWLFTIYITWSPWHYAGQNYGLAVMFLRRRGVPLGAGAKRLLYASFLLAYLLTFLVFHSALGVVNYGSVPSAGSRVAFLPLGIPPAVHGFVFPLFTGLYAATLVAATALLLRRARVRDLLPSAALVLTQALWFSIPFGVGYFGLSTGIEPIDVLQNQIQDYFLFVALGHAVQYLWVTSYYARGSPGWRGFTHYYGKTLASGVAVWMLPVLAFAPVVQGRLEYAGGLGLLVASVVNIHHFILDGAIWKLRHTRIASVLIRAESEPASDLHAPTGGRPWLRRGVWAVASGGLAAGLFAFWLENIAIRDAFTYGDYRAARRALERMAWIGHDSSVGRIIVASSARRAGDESEAERQLLRALELNPDSAPAHFALGVLAKQRGDPEIALLHQREALRLAPDELSLRNDLAWTLATNGDERSRDPGEAIRLAEALVGATATPDPNWLDTLAAAYAAAGRFDEAVQVAAQAAALADAQGRSGLGDRIRAHLALYRERRPHLEKEPATGS